MKAAFGIVALLAAVGVIVWWLGSAGGDHIQAVAEAQKTVKPQVEQLAGRSADGETTFKDSLAVKAQESGGRTVALRIASVKEAGPAETYFGLKRGDMITQIGELEVKGMAEDEAFEHLQDAYSRKWTLRVKRDDQEIILPGGQLANAPPPDPNAPKPPPPDMRTPLQRQLENIGAKHRD